MWKKLDYFSVDDNAIAVADIFDIHNYLMKKNGMVWNVWICKVYICFGNDVFCCNISSVNSLNAISLNAVPLNTVPLIYVSVNNQECKMRLEIINISSNEPLFYPYSIKQVNVVTVVVILMIHIQNYVFLMLLKTWMSKYSI